ncbi:MAG: replication-relaxation family protein [Anaerolineae bacterium]
MMTKRFVRTSRTGIRLTERDLQIVVAVFESRYLTNQMITRLLFKPTTFSTCKQRLRYLFDLGYLAKRQAQVNEPDVYYLGLQGRRYITSLGEYSKDDIDRIAGVSGSVASAPLLMMDHELTISRLYVITRMECVQYGWTLRWHNARMLELAKLGIEPDAWLEVSGDRQTKQAYLEFTSVMPTKPELAAKVAHYEAHWEATDTPIPVLWLTTSRSKQNVLRQGILNSAYKDYFLLGLIDEAGSFLTKKMWWWSESEEMIQWIKPPR